MVKAGKYFFNGHVRKLQIWGHDSTAYFSQVQIRKNDSTVAEQRKSYDYSATTKDLDLQVSKSFRFAGRLVMSLILECITMEVEQDFTKSKYCFICI